MSEEKLTPERAIRLLRAKGAQLELMVLHNINQEGEVGLIVGLAADIAIVAQLLADHIERSIKVEEAVVALNLAWGRLEAVEEDRRNPLTSHEHNFDRILFGGGLACTICDAVQPDPGPVAWGPDHPDYDEMGQ